ncbi:MAG: hypothetical protein JWN99_1253 [Ilumatobacteraceae bacterium]|nr:hypothetical protein [Ilumatobacteraceae bacterium]
MIFTSRERTDRSPRHSDATTFQFLDRIAGPYWDRVRGLIEEWVANYPASDRGEVVTRLRADSVSFRSAHWELYLAALVRAHGGTVTCHPSMPDSTSRPDFLVRGIGQSFYLEAKVLESEAEQAVRDRWRDDIWTGLSDRVISEHFFVRLAIDTYGASAPPISKMANSVRQWLESLDPSVVTGFGDGEEFVHRWADAATGWKVSLTPIRKLRHAPDDRLVGMGGAEAYWLNDREATRKAIRKKSKAYGKMVERPFVVALAVHRMGVHDEDVNQALYGDEVMMVDFSDPPKTHPSRARNGVWLGPRGRRRTRLSAVLLGRAIAPWALQDSDLTMWMNPWADQPLQPTFLNANTVNVVQNQFERTGADRTARECFGLSDDWPGPEPAFDPRP